MKSEKTNPGKGIQPTPKTLYYKQEQPDGTVKYATITAYQVDRVGRYKAWVTHPDFGTELMTEREGRLEGFVPVVALTAEDIPGLVEQIAAKVLEKLEAKSKSAEPPKERKSRAKPDQSSVDVDLLDLAG